MERGRKAAVNTIAVTATQAAELAATVHASIGEYPVICGFCGQFTPIGTMSLACTRRPELVGFEICVMLACDLAKTVWQKSGYRYRAVDFIDEMRSLTLTIGTPHTETAGRDLMFYWPTLEMVVD